MRARENKETTSKEAAARRRADARAARAVSVGVNKLCQERKKPEPLGGETGI